MITQCGTDSICNTIFVNGFQLNYNGSGIWSTNPNYPPPPDDCAGVTPEGSCTAVPHTGPYMSYVQLSCINGEWILDSYLFHLYCRWMIGQDYCFRDMLDDIGPYTGFLTNNTCPTGSYSIILPGFPNFDILVTTS